MPPSNGDPTDSDETAERPSISKRRLMQVGTAGLVGTLAAGTVVGDTSDHPNSIVFDGTVSRGKTDYEVSVTGSITPDGESTEGNDTLGDGSASGAVHRDVDAYRFSGELAGLDVDGDASVRINYGDSSDVSAKRLTVVAGTESSVTYSVTTTDRMVAVRDAESDAAEAEDTVVENDDGTWTATGETANTDGDTFDFWGDVESFSPMDGDYTLFLDGTEVTAYDLTGEEPPETREHSYSFEGTGDSWADYYLEVQDDAEMIATTLDGAVVEPDFHWVSEDGTKAAGRVDPGERHAYEFDNLVVDVTIDGEADALVDGRPSDLDYYPRPGATGDGWKGGFPWQQVDVEREHSYSFEGTGDSWADYYLEVQDDAQMVATTLDGAIIEPDFHWVSDDGTKAAGRVDPGERHAYEFDNLVLDVTIEGEADAFVDGGPSSLDYYPQPGATGDGWKGGFPWQDEEAEPTTTQTGPVVGGGPGYDATVARSEADTVVTTAGGLDDALSSAGSGDVVFVPSNEQIDLGNRQYDIPDGVTLASDRGVDGSAGALLYTDDEPGELLSLEGDSRLTGVRVRGPHPGDDWGGDSSAGGAQTMGAGEIDNCEVWGFSHHGIQADSGDGAHFHHNVVRENNKSGLGYGITVDAGMPVIEYNYFNYNRHSVATGGSNPGYVCRYNHFGPMEVLHNIDAHEPAGDRYEIHNNVVETVRREWDDNVNHIVVIRDAPDDEALITDNWFFNPNAPDADGPTDQAGQAIIQPNNSSWTNVSFGSNHYGADAAVTYSDIIPGYDGSRTN
ncbi:hypothetical protein GJ629_02000 [Halapricum sp. CBA1109]|uniref:right-handed parallel beta-helix repeat-containing protein n=1 Tax=Halapricum sp. CBA1109 TaxID=2668068 RepID=UPI0012FC321C|nr:right-handed parallel beta-helix repeat-containing protein [Halapricum sp. CBA1109]MUV88811.1 hypothetical protein [Halapricum sp. CBA1109]